MWACHLPCKTAAPRHRKSSLSARTASTCPRTPAPPTDTVALLHPTGAVVVSRASPRRPVCSAGGGPCGVKKAGVKGAEQRRRQKSSGFLLIHLLVHSLLHYIGRRVSLVLLTMAANVLIPILFPLSDELEYANGKSKSAAPCKFTYHLTSVLVVIVTELHLRTFMFENM